MHEEAEFTASPSGNQICTMGFFSSPPPSRVETLGVRPCWFLTSRGRAAGVVMTDVVSTFIWAVIYFNVGCRLLYEHLLNVTNV